jgi:hypothetical protein
LPWHGKETETDNANQLGYLSRRKEVRAARTVKAPDKQAAIQKGAQEFKAEVWRLYAVQRR